MNSRARLLPLAVLLLASGLGCSDKTTEPVGTGTVVIQFSHVVGSADLQIGGVSYVNSSGNEYTVSNLEYVVSDFEFHVESTANGEEDFAWEGVHYVTEDDAATKTLTFADVPAADYGEMHFVFGIAAAKNTDGAFPELDTAGMAWPPAMGGGYHYMRHEGLFVPTGGGTASYTTHLGPSGGADYSIPVTIALDATGPGRHGFAVAAGETTTVVLQMDVNQWYTAPNDYDFNDYGAIMGNAAAQALLQENGATVWSSVDPGA
ncbi:MAG: hypothetical protein KC591_00490 [Gemmatimonadetes bacterium]|nr:hypothetical protein [Gemmatimonadota bacterium]